MVVEWMSECGSVLIHGCGGILGIRIDGLLMGTVANIGETGQTCLHREGIERLGSITGIVTISLWHKFVDLSWPFRCCLTRWWSWCSWVLLAGRTMLQCLGLRTRSLWGENSCCGCFWRYAQCSCSGLCVGCWCERSE